MNPESLKYTRDHEWMSLDGGVGRVGITDFAQKQLGDVVYVELPDVGTTVTQGQAFGTIESVKAVSELFAPVSGEVVEVNPDLAGNPELVNSDPFGGGWMIKVRVADAAQVDGLLDQAAYDRLTAEA